MDGYIAGIAAGLAQALTGHPLDTIKTWSQNRSALVQPKYTFKNLWKGVQYPLVQLPIICGVSFGLYENLNSITNNSVVASAISGGVRTSVITPLEYYKIRKQQQEPVLFRQCFRNMHAVCLKEVPSASIYFPSYYYLRKQEVPVLTSGGIAGMLAWGSIYPLDTIKTRVQSGAAKTIREAFQQRGLWVGLIPCLARAAITNSVGFYVYEQSKLFLIKKNI
jgi:hypothetical protein